LTAYLAVLYGVSWDGVRWFLRVKEGETDGAGGGTTDHGKWCASY